MGTLRLGSPMPWIEGDLPGGGRWSSQQHRKAHPRRPMVVSFFATWCPPCTRTLPVLERIRAAAGRDGPEVVLVAFGEGADAVAPYARRHRIGARIVLDPYVQNARRFGVGTLPRTFVVDRDGRISAIFAIEGEDFEQVLREEVARAGR
jgi:thiol-disulfide isomerase/thioredoxin